MRVVGGVGRGRPLRAPAGRATRPTSDRVREAVFDMLTSMAAIEGAAVADLFAGSGALGIEALSRGAGSVAFVDSAAPSVAAVRANLAAVPECADRARVVRADAVAWATASGGEGPWDLVMADPPYAWDGWEGLLAPLAPVTALLVAETGGPWEPPGGWRTVKARRYGSTVVTIVAPHTIATSPAGGRR